MKSPQKKNVTLSLPEPLLRRFRAYAAERGQSMSDLMAEAIRGMVDPEIDAARGARLVTRIKSAPDRGTGVVIRWTRDDMRER